ncbi:MAG: NAD(P)H-hydrate dehydratase [Alphaproteobacteria bacterium]
MPHPVPRPRPIELLTPAAMGEADRRTIAGGRAGIVLMEAAGAAVAARVRDLWDGGSVVVLCGPGNNGGDGFVAARRLAEWGFEVRLHLRGEAQALAGDARLAAERWARPVRPFAEPALAGAGIVVDALFGAGLTRPLAADVAAWVEACAAAGVRVVAVDLPSGVNGANGRIEGHAFDAFETVTFARAKPGHVLLPGALKRGHLTIADIGLDPTALAHAHRAAQAPLWCNLPGLWAAACKRPVPGDHKYRRGHANIVAGPLENGGAARLAATAALAAGAGLVSLLCPPGAVLTHTARLDAVMVRALAGDDLAPWLADERRNAWLLGPGGGVGAALRAKVEAVLARPRAAVLDADAITSFAGDVKGLARAIRGPVVLTPHAGEAARLCSLTGDKLADARGLAAATGAVVLLKGFDTVVAAPDGRAAIAVNGCPALATAGAGDVLAGVVTAQLAQGLDPFDGAALAVWLHNAAAAMQPHGLTADQLVGHLAPAVAALDAVV